MNLALLFSIERRSYKVFGTGDECQADQRRPAHRTTDRQLAGMRPQQTRSKSLPCSICQRGCAKLSNTERTLLEKLGFPLNDYAWLQGEENF